MIDGISLDHLRIFIAAAEEGSFSAAGRRLNRAQSVISQTIATLEGQTGVILFDRSGRYPVITPAGRMLLADAKVVTGSVNALRARAKGLAAGLEPELSVAIDVMFPMAALTRTAAAFGAAFPLIPLRIYVEVLGGVVQAMLDGRCQLGVMGSLPMVGADLVTERLLGVKIIIVAAREHPLAQMAPPVPQAALAGHIQLVLTDRSALSQGQEFNVLSARNWRLADLGAKHAFLRAGLGWGGMPFDLVARDLAEGVLVELDLEDFPDTGLIMPMMAVNHVDAPPGPAGRWFIEHLKHSVL